MKCNRWLVIRTIFATDCKNYRKHKNTMIWIGGVYSWQGIGTAQIILKGTAFIGLLNKFFSFDMHPGRSWNLISTYTESFKKIWTVNGETFLNMLTTRLMPQLEHDSADFVCQPDGAPCHYHRNVRKFLNETLPHRWIGRAVNNDQHLLTVLWPPRSPDLTPCDFFL